jgi:hypothetical protein
MRERDRVRTARHRDEHTRARWTEVVAPDGASDVLEKCGQTFQPSLWPAQRVVRLR